MYDTQIFKYWTHCAAFQPTSGDLPQFPDFTTSYIYWYYRAMSHDRGVAYDIYISGDLLFVLENPEE
jgi:hypothetical protein